VRVQKLDYLAVPDDLLGTGDVLLFVSGSEIGQRVDQHRNVTLQRPRRAWHASSTRALHRRTTPR
jgi:hypothetical protein